MQDWETNKQNKMEIEKEKEEKKKERNQWWPEKNCQVKLLTEFSLLSDINVGALEHCRNI